MTAVGLSCAHDESSQPRGSTVGRVMVTLQQVRPPHFSELGEDFSTSDSGLSTDSTAEPCMTNEYSLCDVIYNAMTSLYHFMYSSPFWYSSKANTANIQCKGEMKLRGMEQIFLSSCLIARGKKNSSSFIRQKLKCIL